MSRKLGFWSVMAIVMGCQIGSGVFMLPASLAPYGIFGLLGWLIAGCGAIALCFVFASLCARFPQTGGPHVYAGHAFGPTFAFFTGWTYWVISWVSTTAVIVTCIGYLSPFIGNQGPLFYLSLELLLLLAITLLNLRGLKIAGRAEFLLSILKCALLILIPLLALSHFDAKNFSVDASVSALSQSQILSYVTLLTLWGFIGLESATVPAESIENASKTIPRAIVLGTLAVALLYVFNCIGVMGMIPGSELIHSKAPYIDATQRLFGGNWHLLVSIAASIACLGTLNAWILTSGQIVLGLAQDRLMPALFARKNTDEAPVWGIVVSSLGIGPLLVMTANASLAKQITDIIDISVVAFLFVYLICCIGLLRIALKEKGRPIEWLCGTLGTAFCLWIIYMTPVRTLLISSLFTLSGLPMYLFWYRRPACPNNETRLS